MDIYYVKCYACNDHTFVNNNKQTKNEFIILRVYREVKFKNNLHIMHEFVFVFFRIQNRNNVKNTRDEPDYFLFNEQTNKQKNAFHPQILP